MILSEQSRAEQSRAEASPLTGYPSIDRPWLKYYEVGADNSSIPDGTLLDAIIERNSWRLDDSFIEYFGRKISGRRFLDEVSRTAEAFRLHGVKRGDVVTLSSVIVPEAIYSIYALNQLGAIVNSVYIGMSAGELLKTLLETKSKFLVFSDLINERVRQIIPDAKGISFISLNVVDSLPLPMKAIAIAGGKRSKGSPGIISFREFVSKAKKCSLPKSATNGSDEAAIVYTSGSSGTPKGVILSNTNINSIPVQYLAAGFAFERGDSFMTFVPPFLSVGLCLAMHMPLWLGLTLKICPDPSVEAVTKAFLKNKPNHFMGSPANALAIAEKLSGNCSWVKTLGSGGESATVDQEIWINNRLKELGSSAVLATGYGMSELAATATTVKNDAAKIGTLGIPLPLTNVKIVDCETREELGYGEVGELLVLSPGQTPRYFNNEKASRELFEIDDAGRPWVKTEDLASIDADGFVRFEGRMKRVFLHQEQGGSPFKIFPQRLENVLREHPCVKEAAVIAVDHPAMITVMHAFIVAEGNEEISEGKIRSFCSDKLPDHMVPERVFVVSELPRLANGKIDYRSLSEKQVFE